MEAAQARQRDPGKEKVYDRMQVPCLEKAADAVDAAIEKDDAVPSNVPSHRVPGGLVVAETVTYILLAHPARQAHQTGTCMGP